MVIYIEHELFENEDLVQQIIFLFSLVVNDENSILCDYSELENSDVLKNNYPPFIKGYLEASFNKVIMELEEDTNERTFRVDLVSDDNSFSIEEAIRFFINPISIILENSNYDELFLKTIFKFHNEESEKIRKLLNKGRIIFENGGGKDNIRIFIEGRKRQFSNLPKEPHKYFRYFVFFDSDKRFLNESKNDFLKTYLNSNNIVFHELEKREMENYLPDEVFKEINDDYCNRYLNLNNIQKDFFDIEKGWNGKKFDRLAPEIQQLYTNLSEEDKDFFRKNKFDCKSFKSTFVQNFEKDVVTKRTLQNRISHQQNSNEFVDIINKIKGVQ